MSSLVMSVRITRTWWSCSQGRYLGALGLRWRWRVGVAAGARASARPCETDPVESRCVPSRGSLAAGPPCPALLRGSAFSKLAAPVPQAIGLGTHWLATDHRAGSSRGYRSVVAAVRWPRSSTASASNVGVTLAAGTGPVQPSFMSRAPPCERGSARAQAGRESLQSDGLSMASGRRCRRLFSRSWT